MKLSKYFDLSELTKSNTADKYKIDNTPNDTEIASLKDLCCKVDVIREYLGKAIKVTSGFRCEKLNSRVGGSKNSQHRLAKAMDFRKVEASFTDNELYEVGKWIYDNTSLAVGIYKGEGFIHVDTGAKRCWQYERINGKRRKVEVDFI